MKTLHIVSLGCAKNQVDTEVMLSRLQEYELTDDAGSADVLIVNSCGFIEAAKSESINTVLRLHQSRKNGSLLVMAGCMSERYKEELERSLVEVDIFTGVADYAQIDRLIAEKRSGFSEGAFLIGAEERVVINSNYHAYIKLSEGCDQKCSFCAIPSFKGKLKSRPIDEVIDEVNRLAKRGFYDFSFIAQDSSSYLRDKGENGGLKQLIAAFDALPHDIYGRILYLYPSTTDKSLIEAIKRSKKIQNYFDMPVQHISDAMLKRMKRGSGTKRIKELLDAMRAAPDSFVRTSVIVGHPNESDEDFEELFKFLNEFDFDKVSVFAYSDEEGTPAYTMKNKVDKKTLNARLKKIEKLLKKKSAAKAKSFIGKNLQLTVDGENEESELLLNGKAMLWAPEIDGMMLITDNEADKELAVGKRCSGVITGTAGDALLVKITG